MCAVWRRRQNTQDLEHSLPWQAFRHFSLAADMSPSPRYIGTSQHMYCCVAGCRLAEAAMLEQDASNRAKSRNLPPKGPGDGYDPPVVLLQRAGAIKNVITIMSIMCKAPPLEACRTLRLSLSNHDRRLGFGATRTNSWISRFGHKVRGLGSGFQDL